MRKSLALFLALALALSLLPAHALAAPAQYDDVAGHWAESAIQRWSGYDIVEGVDGHFLPDQPLTRAAMAKILANTLGLTDPGTENPFSDVPGDAWFAPYILRCHAAGILKGDGDSARPNASISRQEAMVMLCRALSVAEVEQADLGAYGDAADVAPWAKGSVAAMLQAGMVNGVGGNKLAPAAQIDRASILAILDRAVVQYINAPGQYDLSAPAGTVLVAAGDVTLKGNTSADVLVTQGAHGKNVTFGHGFAAHGVILQSPEIGAVNNTGAPLVMVTMDGGVRHGKTLHAGDSTGSHAGSGGGSGGGSSGGSSRPSGGGGGGGGGGGSSHTHRWDAGTVIVQPTCVDKGVKTYACSGCKTTKTESLPALGHDWGDWSDIGDNHQRTCKRDAAHTETQPHTWDDGVVITQPDGLQDGVKVYTCAVCKATRTERLSGASKTVTDGLLMDYAFDMPGHADYVAPLPADESTVAFYVNDGMRPFSREALRYYVQDTPVQGVPGKKLPGAVVEFYIDDATGIISAIKVFAHNVAEVTGNVQTRIYGGSLQIRVPGVFSAWRDATMVTGYAGLTEGDVVLYYYKTTDQVVMEKAEKVTGIAYPSSKGFTIDNTLYSISALKNMTPLHQSIANMTPGMTWTDEFNEYDFFLDKNGSLVYWRAIDGGYDNVALVLDATWSAAGLQAKLLLADGTTPTVTVSKLDYRPIGADTATALNAKVKKAFFNYRVMDGKYELVEAVDKGSAAVNNDWLATVPVTDATVEKRSRFAGDACVYASNNHTVFLVERDGGQRYDAYTGFRDVPELEHANGIAIADNDNRGVARYVYLEGTDKVYEPEEGVGVVLHAYWRESGGAALTGKLEVNLLLPDGKVRTLDASKLDGEQVGAVSAGALNAKRKKAFFSYRIVGYECELTECVAQGGWTTATITDAATEKVSKFAGNACPYTADDNTVFLVERTDEQNIVRGYYCYTGFKSVPEMQHANGIAIADNENPGVARYVFLNVQQPQSTEPEQPAQPDGLVFLYSNEWECDLDNVGMFLVNAVGTDGQRTQLSVTEDIKNAVAADMMTAADWNNNQYVGQFWAIDEVDEKGNVYALAHADAKNVTAMGAGVVTTTGTSMDYDNITRFYFVDIRVDDGQDNTIASDDKMALGDFGEFDPENFFNADDVDPEGTNKVPGSVLIKDAEKSCHSVKAVMLSQDGITADYVYVVRIVW